MLKNRRNEEIVEFLLHLYVECVDQDHEESVHSCQKMVASIVKESGSYLLKNVKLIKIVWNVIAFVSDFLHRIVAALSLQRS